MRWIGLKTLIIRECEVIARFWRVTLAPPVIMTGLYFVVFGEVVGRRIVLLDGIDYTRFIAPGLILSWVISSSFGHAAAGLIGARLFRFIEELLVSPLPDWVIMAGYVIGGTLRGLLVGTAVFVTALIFMHVKIFSLPIVVAALLLAAVVSALGGFITALLAKSFDHVTTIQTLILMPLIYLSGVFAPISSLPEWARDLSFANPMFHAINAFRYGFLGVSDASIGLAFSLVCTFGVLLMLIALALMMRGSGLRDLRLRENESEVDR